MLIFLLLFAVESKSQSLYHTFTTNDNFVVPAGITKVTVEAWGGGGGGGLNGNNGAGGGGGGAYAKSEVTVIPGNSYAIIVGTGGVAGMPGGNSSFATNVVVAAGGHNATGTTGGIGGLNTNCIGTVRYSGGNGGDGNSNSGGGGGSSASTSANGSAGGDASGNTGGVGGTSGGTSGAGGKGGNTGVAGANGLAPGGGGGGTGDVATTAGTGGNGQVTVTWDCPATAGTLSGATNICYNGTTTLSSTVPGGTWSSSNPTYAAIEPTTGKVTAWTAGIGSTVTMTYTVVSEGCTPKTTPWPLTIDGLLTISGASASPTLCINEPMTTLANTIITHATEWATGIGEPSGLPDGVTATFESDIINRNGKITISGTPTEPGTFNYSIPVTATCGGSNATGNIIVYPTPNATATPASQTICSEEATAIALTSNVSGTVFSWTVSQTGVTGAAAGSGNSIAQILTASGNVPGTATYTITPTANGCSGTPKTVVITVNPIPTVIAPSAQIVCNSQSTTAVNFTGAVTGTIYKWTNNTPGIGLAANGTGDIGAFTAINAGNSAVAASITVTPEYTNAGVSCSGTPKTFTITVNPTPNVTATPGSQAICSGGTTSIALTSNVSGTTFSWTVSQTGVTGAAIGSGSSIAQTLNATGTTPGTATYTITPSANGCTGNPVNVVITVNPIPTVNNPSSQIVCNSQSTTAINFTGAVAGTVYNWTNNTPGIGLPASGTGNIGAFTAVNTGSSVVTATVTVTPEYSNAGVNCSGTPKTLTITVNPTPNIVATPASQTICQGETTSIALSSSVSGTTYSWTVAQSGVTGAAAGSGNNIAQTLTATGTAPGTATYTITPSANGCTGNPVNVVITVNPIPTVNNPSSQIVCNSQSTTAINFTGAVAGTVYNWTNNTPGIGLPASGTGNIGVFTAVNAGVAPILATVTVTPVYSNAGKSCSGAPKTLTITVNPTPNVVATPASQTICSGETTSIALSSSVSGTTFSWTVAQSGVTGAAAGSGNNMAQTLTATGTAPGIATYTITPSANGCTGSPVIVTITVNPLPVPTITGSNTSCSGSTGNTYSTEAGMTSYVWSVSAGGSITGGQGTNTITVSWSTSGSQAVTVKYTDSNSCTASPATIRNIIVNPKPNLVITNPAAVCYPATVDLTATAIKSGSTAGLTYTYWTDAAATVSLANPATATAGTYWIMGTTAAGCSDIKPVIVTVHPKPTVVITNPTDLVCSPATVDLSASSITSGSTAGLVYTYWRDAAGTISLANHTTVATSGTYYIKGTNNNGCFDIQPVTVVVNQTPSVTNASTMNVCSGSSTSITLTADVPGTTFTWIVGTITGTVTGITTGTVGSGSPINHVLTSSGNGGTIQYIVTPTSPAGCIGSPYTITVTVQTPPTVYQHPEDPNIICSGGNATFISYAYGLPAPTIQWQYSKNNGSSWINVNDSIGITGSHTNVLSVINPPNGRKYRARYTNNGACGIKTTDSNVSTISINGNIKIAQDFEIEGCGDGVYNLFIELQGDQIAKNDTARAYAEWYDGTTWHEIVNSRQALQNGHPTYSLDIYYSSYPPTALFRIIIKTKKCALVFDSNPLPFGTASQITVANTCLNKPVTFSHNGMAGGTWTIKDPGGNTVFTLANAPGSTVSFTPAGQTGCYSATYATVTPGLCSDTKNFVVFPDVVTNPVVQQNTCGLPLEITPANINSFFITEYSIQAPGSSTWSAYRDLNATNAALTNAPGCWTIKSRYKTSLVCDLTPAGTISPCAESTISAVVYPAAPVLVAPFNTCNAVFTLPVVPAISGFTTEWKVDGGTYTSSPTLPTTPGCHTLQARYVLASNCGTALAGAAASSCESNVVSVVIFPPAPPAPSLNAGCGATITVTPPSPVPSGFSVEYSFNNGAAGSWGSSNTFTATDNSCDGYRIKTRYVLSGACGLTGAGANSSSAACSESPATLRMVDISAPVITCTSPAPSPVCVNTPAGDVYVHSGINWDATVTDNCTITSITASLSGATTAIDLTTLNGVTFNLGTTTITWSASDECNTSTCSFTVTVNPKPYIDPINITICSGNTFAVTPLDGINGIVPPGTTYSWSAPSVTGVTGTAAGTNTPGISGTLINSTNVDKNVEYLVTPTTGNCSGTPFKVTVTVHPAPVMDDPQAKTFCVENIYQAIFHEPTIDITPGRPDYYTVQPGDLDLNANRPLHWSITDALGVPVNDTNGAPLTDVQGAVTNYLATVSTIVLMGAPSSDVSYTISYWLVDLCGTSTPVKTATITIKPRPDIIKLTN